MTSKGFTNVSLGERMGISKQAIGQMLKADSLTTASLEKIASALDVPMWQLFASPEEVAANTPQEGQGVRLVCPHCGKPLRIDLAKSQE